MTNSRGAAEFLVALTSSETKKALVSAAVARKSLEKISESYRVQVEALWDEANKEALKHLNVVLGNNPHKSLDAIMARPDVQSAMRAPYEEAAAKSEALLKEAWNASVADTVQKSKGELKLLGVEWSGYEEDASLLGALVSDLHANAKAMRARYRKALSSSDDRTATLKKVANDSRTRSGFSLSVCVWAASSQARRSIARLAGLGIRWVSRMDKNTCTHCRALHGVVRSVGEPFPDGGLRTYKGLPLYGPPRHPRCRCILVYAILKKPKTKS